MKSRIELAVETAMRFLPIEANPRIGRVLFKKDYVYATDGRIAVRIRVDGGGFADCGHTTTNCIDVLCDEMRRLPVLPRRFYEEFEGNYLAGEWNGAVARLRSRRISDLRDIDTVECPHCRREFYLDTCVCAVVTDEEHERIERTAYGRIDPREVTMSVRIEYQPLLRRDDPEEIRRKCAAIDYKYAKLMCDVIGVDGTYTHGCNPRIGGGSAESFYGVSRDGYVEVVAAGMALNDVLGRLDDVPTAECHEEGRE